MFADWCRRGQNVTPSQSDDSAGGFPRNTYGFPHNGHGEWRTAAPAVGEDYRKSVENAFMPKVLPEASMHLARGSSTPRHGSLSSLGPAGSGYMAGKPVGVVVEPKIFASQLGEALERLEGLPSLTVTQPRRRAEVDFIVLVYKLVVVGGERVRRPAGGCSV